MEESSVRLRGVFEKTVLRSIGVPLATLNISNSTKSSPKSMESCHLRTSNSEVKWSRAKIGVGGNAKLGAPSWYSAARPLIVKLPARVELNANGILIIPTPPVCL